MRVLVGRGLEELGGLELAWSVSCYEAERVFKGNRSGP